MATTGKARKDSTAKRKHSAGAARFDLVPSPRGGGRMLAIRANYKLNRDVFARLFPISPRSLATIESGKKPGDAVARRLTELGRIFAALSEVIEPESIGEWMTTPNDAFDGLKPLEVIERGEVDRLWQMVVLLRSGVPA